MNLSWNHSDTYTILRKERTESDGVFNYFLLPAVIIKNCLPMPVHLSINHYADLNQDLESRYNPASSGRPVGSNRLLGEYALQRGEEMIWDSMPRSDSPLIVNIHLNDNGCACKGLLLQ